MELSPTLDASTHGTDAVKQFGVAPNGYFLLRLSYGVSYPLFKSSSREKYTPRTYDKKSYDKKSTPWIPDYSMVVVKKSQPFNFPRDNMM